MSTTPLISLAALVLASLLIVLPALAGEPTPAELDAAVEKQASVVTTERAALTEARANHQSLAREREEGLLYGINLKGLNYDDDSLQTAIDLGWDEPLGINTGQAHEITVSEGLTRTRLGRGGGTYSLVARSGAGMRPFPSRLS